MAKAKAKQLKIEKTVSYPANRHGKMIGTIRKDTYAEDPTNPTFALSGRVWYTAVFPDGTEKEAGTTATSARDLLVKYDDAHQPVAA